MRPVNLALYSPAEHLAAAEILERVAADLTAGREASVLGSDGPRRVVGLAFGLYAEQPEGLPDAEAYACAAKVARGSVREEA